MEQSQRQKMRQMHMKQITVLVLLGILLLFLLLNLIPGQKGSEKPKFRLADILSGQYMQDYEGYQTETVAARGVFVSVGNRLQMAFGKTVADGIYQGSDHYLFSQIAKMDGGKVRETIQAIQNFQNTYYDIQTTMMLVPHSANVLSNLVPASAVMEDQKAQFAQIQGQLGDDIFWVDVQSALKDYAKDEIYYHTDEHWTSLGAYYAYEALAETLGYDTNMAPDWKSYVVNNDFNGELSKKSGYENGYKDCIRIYSARDIKNNTSVLVENKDTGAKTATLYDTSWLERDEKYNLFLGGECGRMDIRTGASSSDRLLVFRDSYANSMIPFLVPYYREIVLIDPQLYDGDLASLLEEVSFTDVLVLCSGNTFVQDTELASLLNTMVQSSGTEDAAGILDGTGEEGLSDEITSNGTTSGDAETSDEEDVSAGYGTDNEEDESRTDDGEEDSDADETE